MIWVRIGPPHLFECRKRWLNGMVLQMRPEKNEVPCLNRCGLIKIPRYSKVLRSKHRPKFWSPLPAMVTSPYEWKILEQDVKLCIINQWKSTGNDKVKIVWYTFRKVKFKLDSYYLLLIVRDKKNTQLDSHTTRKSTTNWSQYCCHHYNLWT
jgi:hypothetical protein